MAVSLLDLPAEILHAIFALVNIGTLARWLAILCPDELIDDDIATKMQLSGEMRLRDIAIDAHRHMVARFGAVHMAPCLRGYHFESRRHPGYYPCLFCDIFNELPATITDGQMACILSNMQPLVELPRSVCFHVLRAVEHVLKNVKECTCYTGPIDPHLFVLYKGKLYPPSKDIERSLVIWVSGDLPPQTRIHKCVVVNYFHRSTTSMTSFCTSMTECFIFHFNA